MLYPLKFAPIFKPRIWGGRRLATLFSKPLPADQAIGESWELSGLPGDESVVSNGPLAGKKLTELVARFERDLLGYAELDGGQFPLLVKLLDARDNLSVQVHPDAASAKKLGADARPKSESWYVVDADAGARIWVGLEPGVDRARFAAAVEAGNVGDLLHSFPVQPGMCFHLPAGTVHALGAGLVIAEIQTPSDTTYRVFDWNRLDAQTGKPRQLHLAEALESIHYQVYVPAPRDGATKLLVSCQHFAIERTESAGGSVPLPAPGQMAVWQVLSGRGSVTCPAGGAEFAAGDLLLFPASMPGAQLDCSPGSLWLQVTIPRR